MRRSIAKRSSWASGNGKVPSNSIGFCVAITMNGVSNACVSPSTVTWRSCIASSSAACVFGEARLASSTRTRFEKIAPGRKRKRFVLWSYTWTPVMSPGSRSGVHCTRENVSPTERAIARANAVLPTPGTSSINRCPSAIRAISAWSTSPGGVRTAASIACRTRAIAATAAAARCSVASISTCSV